ANLVDVRVLSSTGSGRISSVVRGIEWVLAHRVAYNIRVINLSFGAPTPTSYRTDPMSAAVEIAWRRGLVVVAAAGNSGPGRDTVASPGIDPYVITVGAADDHGTVTPRDDTLAPFSSWVRRSRWGRTAVWRCPSPRRAAQVCSTRLAPCRPRRVAEPVRPGPPW